MPGGAYTSARRATLCWMAWAVAKSNQFITCTVTAISHAFAFISQIALKAMAAMHRPQTARFQVEWRGHQVMLRGGQPGTRGCRFHSAECEGK